MEVVYCSGPYMCVNRVIFQVQHRFMTVVFKTTSQFADIRIIVNFSFSPRASSPLTGPNRRTCSQFHFTQSMKYRGR